MQKVINNTHISDKYKMQVILKNIKEYFLLILIVFSYALTLRFNLGLFLFTPFLIYISQKNKIKMVLSPFLLLLFSYTTGTFEWISIGITSFFIIAMCKLMCDKKDRHTYILISVTASIISYLTLSKFTYEIAYLYNCILISVITLIKSKLLLKSLEYGDSAGRKQILHYQLLALYAISASIIVSFSTINLTSGLNLGVIFAILQLLILVNIVDTNYHLLFGIGLFYIYYYILGIESAVVLPIIVLIYNNLKYKNFVIKVGLNYIIFISMYYLGIISENTEAVFLETSIALLIYFLIFENILKDKIQNMLFIPSNKETYKIVKERVNENVSSKLINFASSLELFANEGIKHREEYEKQLENIEIIQKNICYKCNLFKECFNQNSIIGFKHIANALKISKGKQSTDLFCKNIENLKNYIYSNEKFFNANINYKDKSKEILKDQIKKISKTIKSYAVDLDQEIIEHDIILNKICNRLKTLGLKIVYTQKNSFKEKYIDIKIAVDSNISNQLLKDIKKVILSSFSSNITIKHVVNKEDAGLEILHIRTIPNYDLEFAFSYVGKNGSRISGDNFIYKKLSDGRDVFAISDGMGSGKNAYLESKSILELLVHMIDSNLSDEAILNLLSSMISLNDIDEQFSTLDYLVVDKATAKANFYKLGAAISLIAKKNKVIEINNQLLPLGMNQDVEKIEVNLSCEDVIIMVSDGVVEKISDICELEEYILENKKLSTQELAHGIVRYSANLQNSNIYDDMTVIVIKVKELLDKHK